MENENPRHVEFAGCGGIAVIVAILAFAVRNLNPDLTPIVSFVSLVLNILQGIFFGIGLVVAASLLFWLLASKQIRKFIGLGVLIITGLVLVSVVNAYFNWGWRFPDVFAIVSGLISLAFLPFTESPNPQK